MLGGICIHGLILPAVNGQISLLVAVEIEFPQSNTLMDGRFEYACGHLLTVAIDRAWELQLESKSAKVSRHVLLEWNHIGPGHEQINMEHRRRFFRTVRRLPLCLTSAFGYTAGSQSGEMHGELSVASW